MSQVATEPAASTSSLISQRVHPSLEGTGARSADSSLQLKTLGLPTREATPTATPPLTQQEPNDGVRRSRRLVEKSTGLKKRSTRSSTQRHTSRHKHHHTSQSGQSSHTSRPSSTSHSSNSAPAPPSTNPITTSSTERAPQSRSNSDNSSSSSMSTLARAQATSPVQLEHSYALTFSSTAEELSYDNNPLHEAPPTTTPTPSSSSQSTSIPVSVIQTSPFRSDSSLPSNQGRRRRHGLHDRSTRRDITITVPGSSSLNVDSTFNATSRLPPYMLSSSSSYPITALARRNLSHTEHAQNQSGRGFPSFERPWDQSGHDVSFSAHAHNHVHTHEHTHVHLHEDSANESSGQGVPFHVHVYPHYSTAGSEVHTEIVTSRAEETERERERLEHSTAFIAALSRERSTNGRRRGRRRRQRSGERNETEDTSLSSSSQRNTRDRSPHDTRHSSSSLSTSQRPPRRRRTRAAPQSNTSVPLTAVRISPVRSSSHLPSPSHGFQMVPQGPVGVASANEPGFVPYGNSWMALHRRGVQGMTSHGLGGSTSQPIFHEVVSPPHVGISASHSDSPFHPPSYYTRRNGAGESGSHSSDGSGSHSAGPLGDIRVPPLIHVREGGVATFGDGSSALDQAVPRAVRTESNNSDVIIVDSSDSEDDVVIVSHVTPRTNQITTDEEFARRLQDQFDREMDDHVTVFPPPTSGPSHLSRAPLTRPPLNQSSGSLIHDNYEALLSHIHRLSVPDMTRLLEITRTHARRRTGRNPRSQAEFARAMESMGEILLVNALFRAPVVSGTSYEDLLELAETLGPARPQGLPQEVIDNLPQREFTSSLDSSTSGEPPKCVVCMCDFEERDSLRTLPCVHEFHQRCIDQWLKDHRTCPICRVELTVPTS